ncbi:hypothetical protein [Spiroplasma alleghenense]|uniref:ATPase BadF/BadG/BcrA/BcrD type domain-containing protein n=1 Tax=Spiroplasma alleghenense TaxID=216931 RepID=A0A345Z4J7_9MOLU|nr:hypothetical protein [Spiroplasma alleghenense]AXK51526.1 hypothetical protein SALLE_v1c08560 [Spiroplasma alleghenense]
MINCQAIYVDGGATSTKIYFCDDKKNVIEKTIAPRLNLVAFETESLHNLEFIKNILSPYSQLPIRFGIPGIRMYDQSIIKKIFNPDFKDLSFLTDIELQANLLIKESEFNFMSLGTGSVNLERIKNQTRLLGGWGHLLGDYGSAFDFGKTWIRHGINDFENKKVESNFVKITCDFFEMNNFEEIKKLYLNQENFKQRISEFTVQILTKNEGLSLEKKIVSTEIIKKLVGDLKKSNFNGMLPLYVSGGLLKSTEYRLVFLEEFKKVAIDVILLENNN